MWFSKREELVTLGLEKKRKKKWVIAGRLLELITC